MIFKQYYLNCLAHASYLIGDESTRAAVVIDPQRDVDQYLEDAQESNLEIRHVFLTTLVQIRFWLRQFGQHAGGVAAERPWCRAPKAP